MFRHMKKNVVVLAHVDDTGMAGTEEVLKWANEELKKVFTMSGGELFPQEQSPKDPVRFLKKRYYFCEQGVIVKPHRGTFQLWLICMDLKNEKNVQRQISPSTVLKVKQLTRQRRKCSEAPWEHFFIFPKTVQMSRTR